MQLRTHYTWFQFHKTQAKGLPTEGGHKFVLSTWKIVDKTEENFDKYFTPGARDNDPTWREKRKLIERGENPWPDLGSTTSEDTTYAGRAKEHLRTVEQGGGEAWMANDNEGYWSHRNGSVNILLADGNVRSMSYLKLQELFSLPEMDKENPVVTVGPNSPIDVCRKLAH
jgi:prepilin-type processing-associated H-X9-DG protein